MFEDDFPTGPIDFGSLGLPEPDAADHRELYVRDGSRFVRVGAELTRLPAELAARFHVVPAPRCSHGHFTRWAAKNCRPCLKVSARHG